MSCYNRHAEAERGRNAKGGRPRLCDALREVDVAVMGDGYIKVSTAHGVISAAEVIVRAARHAEAVMAFGWAARGPGEVEALYGG